MAGPSSPPKSPQSPLAAGNPLAAPAPVPDQQQEQQQQPAPAAAEPAQTLPSQLDQPAVDISTCASADADTEKDKNTAAASEPKLKACTVEVISLQEKHDAPSEAPVNSTSQQTDVCVVSPTEVLSSSAIGVSTSEGCKDASSLPDTLTIVSPVSTDGMPVDAAAGGAVAEGPAAAAGAMVTAGAAEPLEAEIKTREKGDLVVVGSSSDRTTPSSDSNASETLALCIDFPGR